MSSRNKISNLIYFLIFFILFSLSFTVFYLFRPYSYIDQSKSKIVCNNNKTIYDVGPTFFFAFERKLDPKTDKNVRKLCEYSIINDYQDTYKSPRKINYRLIPVYNQEGSWTDAFLISLVIFAPALLLRAQKAIITSAFFLAIVGFFLLLKIPTKKLYCERQMASRINNFKKSAYGFGLTRIQQEEPYMRTILYQVFQKCLENEGVK